MDAQYAAVYADLYRNHWWWRAREAILVRAIDRLLAGATAARILDVGCGAGLFFDVLEQFGHVEGIESDPAALEQSGKWRGRIVRGELDDTYTPTAPFDLILMLDVLEHTRRPEQMLRRAARLLSPRGAVLVTVPAFRCLWTAHDDLNHHVTRYTAGELRDALRRAGLTAGDVRYMFPSLALAKLLVRTIEAVRPRTRPIPGIPSSPINTALQGWLLVEDRLAGWMPFGSSVLATASTAALPKHSRVTATDPDSGRDSPPVVLSIMDPMLVTAHHSVSQART